MNNTSYILTCLKLYVLKFYVIIINHILFRVLRGQLLRNFLITFFINDVENVIYVPGFVMR